MNDQVTIEKRFCGPPKSGNGGYVCGVIAQYVDGVAESTLRKPPPLEQPMAVEKNSDGSVRLTLDGEVIAEAAPSTLDLKVPDSPGLDEAREAVERYTGFDFHAFPTCFVCGPQREDREALRIFPGETVARNGTVAAPWTPHNSLADEQGNVPSEIIWAALDCPGAFAMTRLEEQTPVVLGRLSVEQRRAVTCRQPHVVIGWRLGHEGRKYYAGTAVFAESGELCAFGRATWIALNQNG